MNGWSGESCESELQRQECFATDNLLAVQFPKSVNLSTPLSPLRPHGTFTQKPMLGEILPLGTFAKSR
jgi:hypothetical protein